MQDGHDHDKAQPCKCADKQVCRHTGLHAATLYALIQRSSQSRDIERGSTQPMNPGDKHIQSRRQRESPGRRRSEEVQKPFCQVICSSHVRSIQDVQYIPVFTQATVIASWLHWCRSARCTAGCSCKLCVSFCNVLCICLSVFLSMSAASHEWRKASFQRFWLMAIAMTTAIVAHLHTRPIICALRSVFHGAPRHDHGLEGEAEVHQAG